MIKIHRFKAQNTSPLVGGIAHKINKEESTDHFHEPHLFLNDQHIIPCPLACQDTREHTPLRKSNRPALCERNMCSIPSINTNVDKKDKLKDQQVNRNE